MEAVAWTAIGLLGVAVLGWFGCFFYLRSKIDAFEARLDYRTDGLNARIDARDAGIEARDAT
jgi:hypothetical protein